MGLGAPMDVEKLTTKRMALYSGRTHESLAAEVATALGIELWNPNIVEFANGEIRPRFADSVRADALKTRPHSSAMSRPDTSSRNGFRGGRPLSAARAASASIRGAQPTPYTVSVG